MKYAEWLDTHKRSLVFLVVALAIAGGISALSLPVGLFPHVDFPRVRVALDAGDRPAERMAIEVTRPVEEAVRAVPGVRSVRSTTSRGSSDISINFDWGEDMISAMLQVQAAVNRAKSDLPPETSFEVLRMDPTVFPVIAYSLTSDTVSQKQLYDIAKYQLRPVLSTVDGVAKIGVQGGQQQEFRVTVDPARLASYGLTLGDVAKALSDANTITALGRMEDFDKLYLIMSKSRVTDLQSIGKTVVRTGEHGGAVLLEDVATVSDSAKPQWISVTADGHNAVLLQVYQQPGGNTVAIADGIKKKLADYESHLPQGVHIANWYDQSQLIVSSASSVRDAVLIGVGLAALILLIFLRSWRTTLIAIVAVPSVLAVTVLLLMLLGMSFNIMTLGGMAAAVGLIIDDMIVMVEHVVERTRARDEASERHLLNDAAEFTRPLVFSSTATVVIFAPLAFLSGVTGAFFKALSLTMAASLIISFFVAWLVVPLLADWFLAKHEVGREETSGHLMPYIRRAYDWTIERLLAHSWVVLVVVAALLAGGWFGYKALGSGFMPAMDEGGFILDYKAPAGTALSETDRLLRQVEQVLQNTPEVETYSRRTGLQLGGGITEANEGDFFIRLKGYPRRNIEAVMDDVRTRVNQKVPGLDIELAQLMEDLIGDLTAVPQPIEVKIFSDDEQQLMKLGPKVAKAIDKIPGVVDVNDGIVLAGDSLRIDVDGVKASLMGMDSKSVAEAVQNAMQGNVATQIRQNVKMVGIRVWIPPGERLAIPDVEKLRIRSPDGTVFPLSRVAKVVRVTGEPQIARQDLKRMAAVTGRISGRDMGSVIHDVKQVLDRKGLLPDNVYYSLGGLYAQQQLAFKGLLQVFVAAVALLFILLLFVYERFRVVFAMMITTLAAVCSVLVGLWVTGSQLNISSIMGMTMVTGIVTEVAIFLVSEWGRLSKDDEAEDGGAPALVVAGRRRIRPVLMTTLAAILALMPLALGIGHGSAMQQPLAIAIISGLTVQPLLVLVVLPALLRLLRAPVPNR